MAALIKIDQLGKPAGVAGFSREDLALAVPVDITVTGGPYAQVLWTLQDKPIDLSVPAQSAAAITSVTSATTQVTPIDYKGTYLLQVLVDSGFGLGATVADIDSRTFYAGPTLNPTWNELPRRVPSFLERLQHNVQSDPIYGALGNARGWAQEWLRWFGLVEKVSRIAPYAWGRVAFGPTALVDGSGIASVASVGVGNVQITFTTPLPTSTYAVIASARGLTPGYCTAQSEATNFFFIRRDDSTGTVTDSEFSFVVMATRP